uniref:Uncharacterized protein n=1 Tax=Heterorhabditis bacteriophora TaxID=37862 RepID=A0A1I7WUW7_HETBA
MTLNYLTLCIVLDPEKSVIALIFLLTAVYEGLSRYSREIPNYNVSLSGIFWGIQLKAPCSPWLSRLFRKIPISQELIISSSKFELNISPLYQKKLGLFRWYGLPELIGCSLLMFTLFGNVDWNQTLKYLFLAYCERS